MFIGRHANGAPTLADFGVADETIDEASAGNVIVKVDTLSIDAWILTTLSAPGMHETGELGSTVRAFGVGVVVASSSPDFAEGDWAYGLLSAQTYAMLPASELTRVVPAPGVDPRAFIGPLGITTGLTAWVGLIAVGEVQAGDFVLVSGAAGAVGSCVVQLATARGARPAGLASCSATLVA